MARYNPYITIGSGDSIGIFPKGTQIPVEINQFQGAVVLGAISDRIHGTGIFTFMTGFYLRLVEQ